MFFLRVLIITYLQDAKPYSSCMAGASLPSLEESQASCLFCEVAARVVQEV